MITALPPGDVVTVRDALEHQLQLFAARADAPSTDDIRAYLAREHYFRTWDRAIEVGDRVIDRRFEAAADAIATGDLATLERLLGEDPQLARARSSYGHRQTLLQHVSMNGVEPTRQPGSPPNSPELARVLLAGGAEADARCESYQPTDTAMTLLCTSCHPAAAGVQGDLVEVYVRGGAAVDGPDADCAPLWAATVWGYPNAVDRLVALGARTDNLVLAAASGDVARVQASIDAPRTDLLVAGHGKTLPADRHVECALIYAAGLNRRDVVEYLLTRNPDLSYREPLWTASALGAATYERAFVGKPDGYPEIADLLRKAGATD